MEKELRKLLLEFDDEENCEAPLGFDYQSSLQAVMDIKEIIEKSLSIKLDVDDQVQDASFFVDIGILQESERIKRNNRKSYVLAYDIVIRFSSFGKMVSIYSNTLKNVKDKYDCKKIISILESAGYRYIDSNILDEKYDGINKYLGGNDTWWTRYFDYI